MAPMKTSEAELELKSALLSTGMVQPVESFSKGGYAEVLSRQVAGQEKVWLDVVLRLLIVAEEKHLEVHVCRRYLAKAGELVYGWFIAIDAKSQKKLEEAIAALKAEVLDLAKPSLSTAGPQPVVQQRAAPPEPAPQPRRTPTDEDAVRNMNRSPHGAMNGLRPRAPVPSGPDPLPPAVPPALVTVETGRDAKGNQTSVQEMPLPFANGRDMNRPNDKGRGARGIG